jgi:uncharacterized protein (TIGR03083 family)
MNDETLREQVRAERTALAAMLAGLRPEQWDEPTLCAGWRVREVAAHITMPFRMSTPGFLLGMLRARGNFNRMADRQARADTARLTATDLLASLRDNIDHPWRPPGGGVAGALSHDVIHGLDISVGRGLDRRVPPERVALVLGALNSKSLGYFGTDLGGVRLEATDLEWTFGEGKPVRGAAQDLLLLISGRRLPPGLLEGTEASRFTSAVPTGGG